MNSDIPLSLYRYVQDQYVEEFMNGSMRFGSLSSYQNIEDRTRRDVNEGSHIDRPGGGVVIKNLSTGTETTGDFIFRNKVKHPDRVYCLCFSKSVSKKLLADFDGAQKCIKVDDPVALRDRMRKALPKFRLTKPIDSRGIIANHVYYYDVKAPVPLDVKDPYNLPFLKENGFANEDEYRFAFGRKGAFELSEKISSPEHDVEAEVAKLSGEFVRLHIGDLRDIAKIVEVK